MNTVVSIIKFPPPPNPNRAMKTAKDTQLGAAPAIIVKAEHRKSDTLNANRLPIISPLMPQNRAPKSMPV